MGVNRQYPENWSKYPQLDYRNEMDGLYSNEPLEQYREENGREKGAAAPFQSFLCT